MDQIRLICAVHNLELILYNNNNKIVTIIEYLLWAGTVLDYMDYLIQSIQSPRQPY